VVETATIISDTVLFIRDRLRTNITDPLSRTSGIGFVMTGYPKRVADFPIITIRKQNIDFGQRLGMQSEAFYATVMLEIRIFARNEKERDNLSQQVMTYLNSNQFPYTTSNTSSSVDLHDFRIVNCVNIDEMTSEGGVLTCSIGLSFKFLYGLD